jgi:predicted Ser/Thr protein kinase
MKSSFDILQKLTTQISDNRHQKVLTFDEFLNLVQEKPESIVRNIFQVFHDMIKYYMGQGYDEYPDDPESIHYLHYDCTKLFEENSDRPFFADRLFANRLVNLVSTMKTGTQQNKIYIFNGPPGCGKSTFLTNLLQKFEEFTNSQEGMRYELFWRLDPSLFGDLQTDSQADLLERIISLLSIDRNALNSPGAAHSNISISKDGFYEISCPSHDFPLLIIPTQLRRSFFSELFDKNSFKDSLFHDRGFHWVFRDNVCTFCSSLFHSLLSKLQNPSDIYKMIYVRPYHFNRRIGEGIAVYNPGDQPDKNSICYNPYIQSKINSILHTSNEVYYLYSPYARTNNGIYALMDIKSNNIDRFNELHNIISEGVHKVENIEENVNSLLLAIMNPEDQRSIKEFKSFNDRIEYINLPYVMDITTEIKIYKHTFGHSVQDYFLPRVLLNFARVIISSRLSTRSDALLDWITEPKKYSLFCDENLQLLKMDIYAGKIPTWLSEDDRKRLSANRRRKILAEADREGNNGISGRDSIKIFNEFFTSYSKHDKLINMSMLCDFFTRKKRELLQNIPSGFIDSLVKMYNYNVLQEVKESLFYYNEDQIAKDILHYIFAVNFEPPVETICSFTGEKFKISEDFFSSIESRLIGPQSSVSRRKEFRESIQWEYTSQTLTRDILLDKKNIKDTEIFHRLKDRYVQNIKEKSLDPFLENENFRMAIKDYNSAEFKTYDRKIRIDVRFLLRNLQKRFHYTEQGAKEVCMYVIDNDLARIISGR